MKLGAAKTVVTLVLSVSSATASAQSLGDIARRERERRAALVRHAPVITNEDLARKKILPEQAEEVMAIAPVIENSELAGLPHTVNLPLEEIPAPGEPGFSLGEYARALRQRKAEPQAIVAVRHLAAPAEEAQAPVREPQARLTETRAHFTELQARVTDTHVCFDQRPVAAPAPVMERSIIRVESGDSLWKLARVHMGDGHLWRLLWRANPEISNPNRIIAGQMLRRPSDMAIAAYRRRHLEPRRDVAQASWGAPQAGK